MQIRNLYLLTKNATEVPGAKRRRLKLTLIEAVQIHHMSS